MGTYVDLEDKTGVWLEEDKLAFTFEAFPPLLDNSELRVVQNMFYRQFPPLLDNSSVILLLIFEVFCVSQSQRIDQRALLLGVVGGEGIHL